MEENPIKVNEDVARLPSTTENIDFGFILENADKGFDWRYLSRIVTKETIKEYPSSLWDMDEFCEHADIDLKYVEDNPDIAWSWRGLSKNKHFS